RIHRQTQDLPGRPFSHRQRAAMNWDAVLIGWLQMNGNRIMDERAHSLFPQMLAQPVTFLALRDVLMIDALASAGEFRQSQRSRRKPVVVNPRDLSSPRVLFIQIFQLHAQDRGLQLVEPRIETGDLAYVSLAPAVFAQ